MPLIRVSGIPPSLGAIAHRMLRVEIKMAVKSVEALGLTIDDVTVEFVSQRYPPAKPDVIAQSVGLFARKKRTMKVRNVMASKIADVLHAFVKKNMARRWNKIEVMIDPPFNDKAGFCSISSA